MSTWGKPGLNSTRTVPAYSLEQERHDQRIAMRCARNQQRKLDEERRPFDTQGRLEPILRRAPPAEHTAKPVGAGLDGGYPLSARPTFGFVKTKHTTDGCLGGCFIIGGGAPQSARQPAAALPPIPLAKRDNDIFAAQKGAVEQPASVTGLRGVSHRWTARSWGHE